MKYRTLGQGLQVSALGVGCLSMTGFAGGKPLYDKTDSEESYATLIRAFDIGVTFFDTAEVYGQDNEEFLGRAIAGRRDALVIATKFGFRFAGGSVFGCDGTPQNAKRACEQSLKRLRIETIDLFYLHRVDPSVPIEESVGAMADLAREGKVRHLGLSEVTPDELRRAHAVYPIAALEAEYSLWERGVERDILPVLRELGIGLVPYCPLGRGFLTGAIRSRADLKEGDYRLSDPRYDEENFPKNLRLVDTITALAAARGVSTAQIALAWLLAQGTDIVPIPGIERRTFLEDSMAAVDLALSQTELDQIGAAMPPGCVAGGRYRVANALSTNQQ